LRIDNFVFIICASVWITARPGAGAPHPINPSTCAMNPSNLPSALCSRRAGGARGIGKTGLLMAATDGAPPGAGDG
jgi:hypothetical protein